MVSEILSRRFFTIALIVFIIVALSISIVIVLREKTKIKEYLNDVNKENQDIKNNINSSQDRLLQANEEISALYSQLEEFKSQANGTGDDVNIKNSNYGYGERAIVARERTKNSFSFENDNADSFDKKIMADLNVINSVPPNEQILFSSKKRGIEVRVPFNNQWGTDEERLLPYEDDGNIIFGPLFSGEGGWGRPYHINFIKTRTASEIIEDLDKYRKDGPNPFNTEPIKKIINGLTVVEYDINYTMCGGPEVEIIGEKYNYLLQSYCYRTSFDFWEDIIKTIKLIK